jgi:hypothetical protein
MVPGTALRRIGWFALLASLWPGVGLAQTTILEGRVTDPLGGTINGAVVTVNSPGPTAPRTTRTGADGTFSFDGVPVGSVSLQVEAPGFERSTQTVPLTTTMAPLAVVLQVAGVVESVGVVAPKLEEELPQIIERSGVRAQTITAAEIQNGGYYDVAQALQALVPGLFVTPRAGPFDYVTASLQGSRTNEILWLVDGVRISNRNAPSESESHTSGTSPGSTTSREGCSPGARSAPRSGIPMPTSSSRSIRSAVSAIRT